MFMDCMECMIQNKKKSRPSVIVHRWWENEMTRERTCQWPRALIC